MASGISAYGNLDSDEDFIEDYEETPAISKKNWFKPANVSLARLDRVKPVATVYNLGLRDPRDLQAGRGKAAPIPVPVITSQLSELQTEPPLSTVSYQKAAWGSQTSIPELLKQAAQAGIRPSRPSSAKTGTISKLPQSRKVRPQSAKDPLCPPGKKKNGSTFGVKGQKFDPSERMGGRHGAPSSGSSLGWAGPPAGLCDPSSYDHTINYATSELQKSQVHSPPAPHASPEPEGESNSQKYSPPPSPMCLSLSLPRADVDVDASEDMDTGRLMEEADKYVKTHKKKESKKIKYFRADLHSPKKTMETPDSPTKSLPQQRLPHVAEKSEDEERAETAGSDLKAEVKSLDSGFEDTADRSKTQINSSQENANANNASCLSADRLTSDLFLELETDSEDGDMEAESEKPLPPSNGFDLKYLGPAQKDRKNRSHPIFLMPEKKSIAHKEPRPSSGRPKAQDEKHQSNGNEVKGQVITKETKKEPGADGTSQPKSSTQVTMLRSGVHIREDCNVTVDITPRNNGRKVTKTPSRNLRAGSGDLADLETKNDPSGKSHQMVPGGRGQSAEERPDPEITGNKEINPVGISTSSAATVSVVYDDDDDDHHKKKTRRRRGPMKKKDVVTMVSNLSLSDDEDDPSREIDIHVGDSTSGDQQDHADMSRRERNYYDVARKQTKDDAAGTEEKENLITVTTKTILFDLEKPKESVVKTILDAPLGKSSKDRLGCASSEKLVTRPKLTGRPKSAKLSKSDLHSVTAVDNSPLPTLLDDNDNSDDDNNNNYNGDGGFTTGVNFFKYGKLTLPQDEEERPQSRMGFVSMETDAAARSDGEDCGLNNKQTDGISQRPPSGKRRPLSTASKTLNRPSTALSGRHHRQNATKENVQNKRRPQSASSTVSQTPSVADVQRANAAAQALRSQREAAARAPSSVAASCFTQSRRQYASYNTKSGGRARAQSASVYRKPVQIVSNNPDLEVEDTETMEECRKIHNRLACYGIDVKPQTLERALFPPSGKTLYYQLDAQLPTSYSSGLLSHPRYWLPEEHRKLKFAEKKLAMAELSLWRQKKEEERKARLAAGKEKGAKKGKKKGKKKLSRSQSVC